MDTFSFSKYSVLAFITLLGFLSFIWPSLISLLCFPLDVGRPQVSVHLYTLFFIQWLHAPQVMPSIPETPCHSDAVIPTPMPASHVFLPGFAAESPLLYRHLHFLKLSLLKICFSFSPFLWNLLSILLGGLDFDRNLSPTLTLATRLGNSNP